MIGSPGGPGWVINRGGPAGPPIKLIGLLVGGPVGPRGPRGGPGGSRPQPVTNHGPRPRPMAQPWRHKVPCCACCAQVEAKNRPHVEPEAAPLHAPSPRAPYPPLAQLATPPSPAPSLRLPPTPPQPTPTQPSPAQPSPRSPCARNAAATRPQRWQWAAGRDVARTSDPCESGGTGPLGNPPLPPIALGWALVASQHAERSNGAALACRRAARHTTLPLGGEGAVQAVGGARGACYATWQKGKTLRHWGFPGDPSTQY